MHWHPVDEQTNEWRLYACPPQCSGMKGVNAMSGGVTDDEIKAILWTQQANAEGVQKVWAACKLRMGALGIRDTLIDQMSQVNRDLIHERDAEKAGKLIAEQMLQTTEQVLRGAQQDMVEVREQLQTAQSRMASQPESGYLSQAVETLNTSLEDMLGQFDAIQGGQLGRDRQACPRVDDLSKAEAVHAAWSSLRGAKKLVEQARVEAEAAEAARETEQEAASHRGDDGSPNLGTLTPPSMKPVHVEPAGLPGGMVPPVDPTVSGVTLPYRKSWRGRRDPNAPKKPEIFCITQLPTGVYAVETPYSDDFVQAMKVLHGKWAPSTKTWMMPAGSLMGVAQALKDCYGVQGTAAGPFNLNTRYERIGGVLKFLNIVTV